MASERRVPAEIVSEVDQRTIEKRIVAEVVDVNDIREEKVSFFFLHDQNLVAADIGRLFVGPPYVSPNPLCQDPLEILIWCRYTLRFHPFMFQFLSECLRPSA